MILIPELTAENFLLFAAKHYDNPGCESLREFENDLKRLKYIKRLLKRYSKTGILCERLILNHMILLHNVFGRNIIPMIFFKFEMNHWSQLKTFLVFLNYLPEGYVINKIVKESDIPLDHVVINSLRKL